MSSPIAPATVVTTWSPSFHQASVVIVWSLMARQCLPDLRAICSSGTGCFTNFFRIFRVPVCRKIAQVAEPLFDSSSAPRSIYHGFSSSYFVEFSCCYILNEFFSDESKTRLVLGFVESTSVISSAWWVKSPVRRGSRGFHLDSSLIVGLVPCVREVSLQLLQLAYGTTGSVVAMGVGEVGG